MGWQIHTTETIWYKSNRFYSRTYLEITFWYNDETFERKETERVFFIETGQEYKLPSWAKIAIYKPELNRT